METVPDTDNNNRSRMLLHILLIYIIFQSVIRIALFIYSKDVVSFKLIDILRTFALGTFYDAIVGAQALLPIFLVLLLPAKWLGKGICKKFLTVAVFFVYSFMIFIGISEYLFWDEFQTSFNFIAVDYLIYTTEVLGNIKESYDLKVLIPAILICAAGLTYLQRKCTRYTFTGLSWKTSGIAALAAMLLPVICFYTIDSNWRNHVSQNKYNVEIAANGPYEFVSAFRNNELDYEQFYVTEGNEKAFNDLKTLLQTPCSTFVDSDSLTRHITNNRPLKTPNIIMIVVESLSADFMSSFGNTENLTPNLDTLAKKSLLFTNLYATGTRTVRGLEALSLSVPPTPGQSIVRRPENQDMFLFGNVLKEHGYLSSFIYGGYGYFDNMNAFYQSNGYNVTDRTDIPKADVFFETVWGVADEILFDQAIEQLDANTIKEQKTFQLIMTTSNHRPYTYPDGRIDVPSGTREGAVKYTDWAIGNFIEKAKSKDWFDNTIFIIIADHQASSAGKVNLPVNRYHIPCIVYAPKLINPEKNNRLMSQIDIPPTVLGMLGFSYDSRFLGYDINTLETGRERAFISTYQNLGYIKSDKLVILKPHNKVEFFEINDFKESKYTHIPKDDTLLQEAVAWYQGASYLYKNKLLKAI